MSDTNPIPGVSEATVAAETPIETADVPAEPSPAEQQAEQDQAQRDADDPRSAAERRAVERVKALREKQAPVTTTTEEAPEAPQTPAETEQQAADRARDERGRFAAKAQDEPRFKVKVLGIEKEVPLSELLRGYGTTEAATQRFQEAARIRQEAEQLRTQQPAAPAAQQTATPAEPEFFDPAVKIRTADGAVYERPYSDVMAYGTPEEIRQATTQMRALMAPAPTQSITPEQVQQIVRYTATREREVQSLQQFLGENSAIVSDPDLATVAAAKVTRLMTEDLMSLVPEYGQQIAALPPQVIADRHAQARHMGLSVRPVGEIFAASAKETAERFGLRPTASGAAQPFAEKVQAKRAATQPISGANARQAPSTDQPRRKTTSEIIQAEREARGLN